MTTAEPWPAAGQLFTVDDLDRMPDDGRRYELVDGVLMVSPAPRVPHQLVLMELGVLLHGACPSGLFVVPGPGVQMSDDTELIPDLVVIRQDQLAARRVTRPPLLAVEIQSPSTALFDLNTKKAVYERFSIESYWVVVPDADQPELIAFERAYQADVSSAGPIFAIGTVVGFVVGMLISYQIIYTDLSEQLPQYATLKAIGYPSFYLVRIVLQQASLNALAGYVPAWFAALALYRVIGALAQLPMRMSVSLTLLSLALTLVMCLISAMLAVRRVIVADPAEVF